MREKGSDMKRLWFYSRWEGYVSSCFEAVTLVVAVLWYWLSSAETAAMVYFLRMG